MEAELSGLEQKLAELLRHYGVLRQENAELRREINALRKDHERLMYRMNEAAQRLGTLLENLPEEET